MVIEAKNIDELVQSSHDPQLFLKIKEILDSSLSEQGKFFQYPVGALQTMVGYRFENYSANRYNGLYPLISIVPQKNNISVYVMKYLEEQTLVEKYSSLFGKSNCGKTCIRFKTDNQKVSEELPKLIAEFLTLESK